MTTRPSKPSSRRSSCSPTAGESVAGAPEASRAGTAMCPSMTASTPAASSWRKGRSSTESSRARSPETVATARCESTAVSPWPGKCLAVVSRLPSRAPRTQAAARLATSCGSSPKERMLITGLAGLLLTSATGAKVQWMPTARASRAATWPQKRAASSERVAPTAMA